MPLTYHDAIELPAGDDWVIPGTLLDADGNPEDLTSATLEWTLLGPDGCPVFTTAGQFSINVVPQQQGNISIFVGGAATAPLQPGRYTDVLRATVGGIKSTMWVGNILVAVNPFDIVCDETA